MIVSESDLLAAKNPSEAAVLAEKVQVPALTKVNVVPEIVQTAGVVEAKDTPTL